MVVGTQHRWLASPSGFYGVANLHFQYRLIFILNQRLDTDVFSISAILATLLLTRKCRQVLVIPNA